jgi:hypothetical protein
MDRLELIALVNKMDGKSAAEIVDAIIAALAPEDGDECPVCGICP